MTALVADPKERFLDLFEAFDRAGRVDAFFALRESARSRFRALSFPGTRTEDWRYTSVAALLKGVYELPTPSDAKVTLPVLPAKDTLRLVFVNGFYQPSQSALESLPTGLQLGSLAQAPEDVAEYLGTAVDARDQVFSALNTSMLCDGAYILLAEDTILNRPIEILHVTVAGPKRFLVQPRILIVAGERSQATIVERYWSATESASYFSNAVTEIVVGVEAKLEHSKVQMESLAATHIANTQVTLAERSNFATHFVSIGGSLVRNEVRARLDGTHAEATLNGLYLAGGTQHVDNLTEIDHAQPHCASHELYKGILSGRAHGVFNGKIQVRPDAQKTDAKQTNKVLLLSEDATINTKPQLEIFADDVKCTHGATIGQLEHETIFYLQSRGIDRESARRLLTFAFANDLIRRLPVETVRDELEQLIVSREYA